MKFRKKPVVIEATQWFAHGDHPKVTIGPRGHESSDKGWIETLEGGHIVSSGDWIITGVKGEVYPCKDEIFKMTYEAVGEKKKPARRVYSYESTYLDMVAAIKCAQALD